MESLKELLDSRASKVKAARDILSKTDAEKRELSADEARQYDVLDAEIDALSKKIDAKNADEKRREKLAVLEAGQAESAGRQILATTLGGDADSEPARASKKYADAFGRYLRGGQAALRAGEWDMLALQTDSAVDGGFVTAAEQFVLELIKTVDDDVPMRRLARKFTVREAVSLGAPTRSAKASTFAWGAEIVAPTGDTSLKFGKRKLYPHYLSGEISVSRDLLRVAVMSVDQIVRDELARDAGELMENAFLTGHGAEQPLGVFTASADGISTGRDVTTGNTTTTIGADNLIECLYNLKASYQARATWLMHRASLKAVRKLKDGNGNYLWAPGLAPGQPDSILNRPVVMDEFAPSTFTTGLYVGIVGDFSNYWIADALDMELQVLNEISARTNQVVYLARLKTDGAPVREEAFARMKLA